MRIRTLRAPPIGYEQLEANIRVLWEQERRRSKHDFETCACHYLTAENLPRISDDALARLAAKYRFTASGGAIELGSIIAGELERRRHADASRTLSWSRWGGIAAIVAALAAIAGLLK